jgi:hypothetical protein
MSRVITKISGTRRVEKAAAIEGQPVAEEKMAAASAASSTFAKTRRRLEPRPSRNAGRKIASAKSPAARTRRRTRAMVSARSRQRQPSSKAAAASRKSQPRESETRRMTRKVEASLRAGLSLSPSFRPGGASRRAARTPRIERRLFSR